jgi:hypothetical protein
MEARIPPVQLALLVAAKKPKEASRDLREAPQLRKSRRKISWALEPFFKKQNYARTPT